MNKEESSHTLVARNDCWYSLGGYTGRSWLTSPEILCDVSETRLHVQSMQMPGKEFTTVIFVDAIYVAMMNASRRKVLKR